MLGTDVGVLGMLLPVGTLIVELLLFLMLLGAESLGVLVELGMASLAGAVEEGVVVSVALGFFSMLLAGFFLLPAVVLFVFFLVAWVVFNAIVET